MINCRDCRERLNDLLEDNFASNEAATRAELRAHLENCADCQRELAVLRAIRDDLRSFGVAETPTDLRAQVRTKLIGEKMPSLKAKAPLFSLCQPRLALSGGALLAACCLLLVVRSSQYQISLSPPPNDASTAPPTMRNFALHDRAFEATPKEDKASGGAGTAKQPKVSAKSPHFAVSPPAIDNPVHRGKQPASRDLVPRAKSHRIFEKSALPIITKGDKSPLSSLPSPKFDAPAKGNNASVAQEKTMAADASVPTPALKTQGSANVEQRGPNESKPVRVGPPKFESVPGFLYRHGTPAPIQGAQSDVGPTLSPGAETKVPLLPSATMGVDTAPNPNVLPPNIMSAKQRGGGFGGSEALSAPPSAAMRSVGPQGPQGLHGPHIMMVRRADYNIAPNTTQTFTLSLVPKQAIELAQVRLTLPDGLQFADAAKDKPETNRIIWRGAAQKDTPIENAVELKAFSNGLKEASLTLENMDGQKLQNKDIVFQVQEPRPTENPKTPPVAEDK